MISFSKSLEKHIFGIWSNAGEKTAKMVHFCILSHKVASFPI